MFLEIRITSKIVLRDRNDVKLLITFPKKKKDREKLLVMFTNKPQIHI